VCRVDDSNCSRTDLGIGDFWVTSERLGYGIKFLIPSYSADDMYLIAPNAKKPETIGEILAKPFSPFDVVLWLWIIAYVAFSALVTAITDTDNRDDFENPAFLARYLKSFFLNATGYVKGGPENSPKSVPARVATWGFGFFCMIGNDWYHQLLPVTISYYQQHYLHSGVRLLVSDSAHELLRLHC
jgi:hypothetical protein